MSEERKTLKPILRQPKKVKGSTLKEKTVNVAGNNDFGASMPNANVERTNANEIKEKQIKQLEKISSTQRVAPATKEKIKLLDYFLPKSIKKDTSFNGVVLRLIDAYIKDNLAERQKKTFTEMYQKRIDELTR